MKLPEIDKRLKIAILAIILSFDIFLMFYADTFPRPWRTLLSFGLLAVACIFATRFSASDLKKTGVPILHFRFKLRQIVNGVFCIIALFVWLLFAMRWIITPIGAIVVLAPCLLLGIAALVFFVRGFFD